jgi:hypothetical protein
MYKHFTLLVAVLAVSHMTVKPTEARQLEDDEDNEDNNEDEDGLTPEE